MWQSTPFNLSVISHYGHETKQHFGVLDYVQIQYHYQSLMILNKEGKVYVKGYNKNGILGVGKMDQVSQWTLISIQHKIQQISMNSDSSLLLTENGQVYSCGSNTYSQLV